MNHARTLVRALVASTLLALVPAAPAVAAPEDAVVVLRDGVAPAATTTALERTHDVQAEERYGAAVHGFAAELTAAQRRRLLADPAVAYVTPDTTFTGAARPPAGKGESVPPGIVRVGAAGAGSADVGVAVVDTGIDLKSAELDARNGTNCVRRGATAHDDHGHGTHVAGTIAARLNGSGVVGVAPGTTLHAVKVLDRRMGGSLSSVLCGLDWVARNAAALDIRVVNMSIGGAGHSDGACGRTSEDALHAAICALADAGVTVVASAGNDAADLAETVPAAYPEVLTVTAMTDTDGLPGGHGPQACSRDERDDHAWSYSNVATTAADAARVIAAPGACVVSTKRGGGTTTMSGTSMAAPHVTGAVALCHGTEGEAGPCAGLTPALVAQRLRADAQAAALAGRGFTGDPFAPLAGGTLGHLVSAATY